jgi:alkylation response protein AidB-like acyl-CoA dehydrogenase
MPLVLTEEQEMLRDSARGYLAEHAPVAHLRRLRDGRDATGFSPDLWRGFAEMGFAGVLVPEQFGGVGLGHVEAGVLLEEMGRTLAPSPFFATAVLVATALRDAGSAAQQQEHLPPIAAAERVAALAVDESAKHRPSRIALAATRHANGFRLNGAKTFVVDGHVADLLVVAARTAGGVDERRGVTLFLVDAKAAGLGIERTVMVDSRNAARLTFDNVDVTADAVLGEVDEGAALLDRVLSVGRSGLAAELIGSGTEVFGRTMDYLKQRKQFGRLIGEFQALQHRATQAYVDLEVARSAVLKALQTLDESPAAAGPIASLAKAKAGQAAKLAAQEAVQMHGGMGMTDDIDIGLFMKRIRVAQELFGDGQFHADQLARLRGY